MKQSFEEFLEEHFLGDRPEVTERIFEAAFENWCSELDVQELIDLADLFGEYQFKAGQKADNKITINIK